MRVSVTRLMEKVADERQRLLAAACGTSGISSSSVVLPLRAVVGRRDDEVNVFEPFHLQQLLHPVGAK